MIGKSGLASFYTCLLAFAMLAPVPKANAQAPAAVSAGKATSPTRLPADAFARFGTLSHPAISPDGKRLAVAIRDGKDSDGRDNFQLAVLHLPDLKPLSRLKMNPHDMPAQIVWVSNTRVIVAIAHESAWLDIPSMTGDIVAVDYDGSHKTSLYDLHKRGQSLHSLDMDRGFAQLAGVPDPRNGHVYIELSPFNRGNYTMYDSPSSEVYDVDAGSGKATLIGKIDKGGMRFVMHHGVARFAYGMPADDETLQTWTRDDANQPWRRLVVDQGKAQLMPLRISANGKRLWSLYSVDGGPRELVSSDLNGHDRKVLASDSFGSVDNIMWAPAEGAPYVATIGAGRPRTVYLNDSMLAQVHKALSQKFPDEAITIAGQSDDGNVLLIHAFSDRDPGTYALFELDTMNLRPLFQVLPWIHPAQMAHREPIRFKASDGVELAGYLTLPLSGSKPYPMVLLPHGGPIGIADHWSYDPDAQFLANRGYAVLQVNYRGSAGRGPAFEHSGFKHFGDRIQQDLIDGVHWAIAQGDAEPKRICVYGGSFGGYSALMTPILAPGLFKCSIDYAGVADWTIGMDRSDTSHFSAGKHYFAEAIGDKAAARAISPLYHLDHFNVPVLIAHGKDDQRVPYSNATQLRAALDKAGKPYVWLVKPKEGHGFYSEEDRTDLYDHMQAFLAKYIGH